MDVKQGIGQSGNVWGFPLNVPTPVHVGSRSRVHNVGYLMVKQWTEKKKEIGYMFEKYSLDLLGLNEKVELILCRVIV